MSCQYKLYDSMTVFDVLKYIPTDTVLKGICKHMTKNIVK
jgi:hypothetical protein